MKFNKVKYTICTACLIFLLGLQAPILAQSDVDYSKDDQFTLEYNKSTVQFRQGRYEEVIAILDTLIKNGLNKSQKELVYIKLSSTYFEIDNIEKGEEYIQKVFRNNPYFEQQESDDVNDLFFQNLVRFESRPSITISLKGGLNFPIFTVSEYFTIIDTSLLSTSNPDSFILKPSGHFAAGVDWHINKNISLAGEFYFMFESYDRKINAPGFRNTVVDYSESFSLLRVPVTVRYTFIPWNRVRPTVFAGAYFSFLSTSSAEIKLETERLDGAQESNLPAEKFSNMINLRNQFNYGVTGGAKVAYNLDYLSFFVEGRVSFDLTTFEDATKRYSDPKLNYEFYYVDNKSTLFVPEISFGISYNVHHLIRKKY